MSVRVDLKSILLVTALGIGTGYYIWNPLVQKHYQEANWKNLADQGERSDQQKGDQQDQQREQSKLQQNPLK